ncbi:MULTISPECIES: tripartite tricarboxylate transporter substrate binding protein [unclassified Achromobacter]|uniref:Bug family tripartite tricarboxylate transporter substrate binding protein n=1 Tax=unclassified Achromobacter TaxID=2626865 RepID=UPI000B51888D|nr:MULTISPECIES: tripartite tricarboxylate transporter substrate binding protein [unclassified Achromobacter]OWT73568.1 twin-arginine translocation pathway signal [Achromobacter sp. HZ34]OWT79515.1 twin-arginine translocation pathway signal [Achromobacter sp. HZ28]
MPGSLRRSLLAALALSAGLAILPLSARADDYPTHPITLVLPFAAGGGGDVLGRVLAEYFGKQLGQPLIVENRPGAGGVIGTQYVARAKPDGYTITIGGMTTHLLAPITNPSVQYNPLKDFVPIGGIGNSPIVMLAANDFPANDIKELKALQAKRKQSLQYGSWGPASTGNFCGEILALKSGLRLEHVPYRGTTEVITGLIGGQIPVGFVDMATAVPQVQGGKLKALALCTKPSPSLPKVRGYVDQGIDFDRPLTWVMYGPAGLPAPVLKKLSDTLAAALQEPSIQQRLLSLGIEPGFVPSAKQHDILVRDYASWKQIADEAHIQMQ